MPQQVINSFYYKTDELIKLNRWLFDNSRPFIKGRVLEVGSGSGIFSQVFAEENISVHLTYNDLNHLTKLQQKFTGVTSIRGFHSFDFTHPYFEQIYSKSLGVFDTVISINIIEQGYCKRVVIDNAKKLLRKKGHLIFITWSHTVPYPGIDFSPTELKKKDRNKLRQFFDNCEILMTRYFSVLQQIESQFENKLGISVLTVSRKK